VSAVVPVGEYSLDLGSEAGTAIGFAAESGSADREAADQLKRALARADKEEAEPESAAAAVERHVDSASEITSKCEKAHSLFQQVSSGEITVDFVQGRVDELLALLGRLDRQGRHEDALRLARATSKLVALVRRWLDLLRLLRAALRHAERVGDADAQGWAKHELGTLNLAAGKSAEADRLLGQAREIRERLGDRRALALTERNLQVLCQSLRQLLRQRPTSRALQRLMASRAVLAATVAALLVAGGAAGAAIRGGGSGPAQHSTALPPVEPGSKSLVVELRGKGRGRVHTTPGKLSCQGTCTAAFRAGTVVELDATALPGSTFEGWSGDCARRERCVVRMDRARSVAARFEPGSRPQTLRVVIAGKAPGRVQSVPAKLDCTKTCEAQFRSGSTVKLVATASGQSSFAGWSGDCTSSTCTVDMRGPRTVIATFSAPAPQQLLLKPGGDGNGVVRSDPPGINCPRACSATFGFERAVSLVAEADAKSIFLGWSGDCDGTDGCGLTMNVRHTVSANFGQAVRLHIGSNEGGSLDVVGYHVGDCTGSGGCRVARDAMVTLQAHPSPGYYLQRWDGADCGEALNCPLTMGVNRRVTALFGQIPA
jgi:Divergent InlB B-repeat domain